VVNSSVLERALDIRVQWLNWGRGEGGSASCSDLSPCNSMSPLMESIKCYIMPKLVGCVLVWGLLQPGLVR